MIGSRTRRLKRRLLREAVAENVATQRGERPGSRHGRRAAGALLRTVVLIVTPALVVASGLVLSSAHRGGAGPVVPGTVLSPVTPAVGVTESLAALDGPVRLDPAVFPLPVRRVILDPGHGGENTGAMAPGGLVEKDLTLDIARRLRELLDGAGLEVVLTRDADEMVSLEQRARTANLAGGDIFVSIHLNWIVDRAARGIETYYLGPSDDPHVKGLAARENTDSGYSLADLRTMLERVYGEVRGGESRDLAVDLQRELLAALGGQDRGVKRAPFIVLIATEMPAVLAEVSCLSHADEAARLADPAHRQEIALSLFGGILAYSERAYRRAELGG